MEIGKAENERGVRGDIHYTCYDRISGKKLPDIMFSVYKHHHSEAAVKFQAGLQDEITVPVGSFYIEVIEETLHFGPAFIQAVRVEKNKITNIRIYIGSGYVS
ncbi:hypothetical protein [Chitinophaga sancti]|uniref:Uncharacterized protein n=1 Tax=Chitinophaga sancti TaxID=1004 RepID=A0A1K1MKB1_9BACT|nr:hypothetical protein [Chitinophaga sancti]WQD62764.1 hypothetical protein U0033_00050 [Chitinophaga sancti]WQG91612.1 hypothetical protein SR876_08865 [Chitinophaga sancti]SFW23620.1 hypothetical protein SAMN05661012_00655 [Chitinophaga sancti]